MPFSLGMGIFDFVGHNNCFTRTAHGCYLKLSQLVAARFWERLIADFTDLTIHFVVQCVRIECFGTHVSEDASDVLGLSGLMRQACSLGFYTPYKVGLDHIPISLLQFADDAIIIGDCSARSIWALKGVLKLFELSSGLKINYSKSSLFGVNIKDAQLNSTIVSLHCKLSAKSFTYLGIPVGITHKRKSTWNPLIDKIRSKLTSWKSSQISFGGRMVLFRDKSNGWEWKFDKTKQYSVKSAYYSITTSSMEPNFSTYPYQLLWKSKAPLKVLSFAWRLFQDRIPTKDALFRRDVRSRNDFIFNNVRHSPLQILDAARDSRLSESCLSWARKVAFRTCRGCKILACARGSLLERELPRLSEKSLA
ncbi:hypothetical protein Lal_00033388 [Lupinus albus]|nr:hypothetical protein Lal_00033388 [Lupinus albus]